MGLDDLPVSILEHQRASPVQDPGRTSRHGGRVPAGRNPLARCLCHREANGGLTDEARQESDGVGASADARQGQIRQPAFGRQQLSGRLIADDPLQIADEDRIRVRSHCRSQDVVRGLDVRHPVAHRLVDGVLQGGRAGCHWPDLGAERVHA